MYDYKSLKWTTLQFIDTLLLDMKLYKVIYHHYENEVLADRDCLLDLLVYDVADNSSDYTDFYCNIINTLQSRTYLRECLKTIDYFNTHKKDVAKVKQIQSLLNRIVYYVINSVSGSRSLAVNKTVNCKVIKEVKEKLLTIK